MHLLPSSEVWFITGSQDLYGPATLKQVAVDSPDVIDVPQAEADVPGFAPVPPQGSQLAETSTEISVCLP